MASIKNPAISTDTGENFAYKFFKKGTCVERLDGRTKDILSSAGFGDPKSIETAAGRYLRECNSYNRGYRMTSFPLGPWK